MRKIYLLMLSSVLCSSVALAQKFVTQDGAGSKNGANWANAYDASQLQAAINAADAETDPAQKQVWVAKGIYKPTERLSENIYDAETAGNLSAANDRDKSFILKAGVAIYGGFAGTEGAIGDRTNITTANETILSGDLNDSNTADDGDAYHVVAARDDADGAILDGFTIQHGYGNDGNFADMGGAYRMARNLGGAISFFSAKMLTFSNLMIKDNKTTSWGGAVQARSIGNNAKFYFLNVIFQNNVATARGGAIYAAGADGANTSSINFASCKFINNSITSDSGNGGGAIIHENYILNITGSTFDGNQSGSAFGGAIRLSGGTANIVSSTFQNSYVGNGKIDDDADGRGGAIYSTGSATLNISGTSKFKNNGCLTGGAHIYLFSGTATITGAEFEGGDAGTSGGAIYVATGATLNTTFSTFKGNKATNYGGAIYSLGSATATTTISKNKFYSNTANATGGAIYFSGAYVFVVDNCVFYDNISKSVAATSGAAIYQGTSGSDLKIVNSTFYFNKSGCTEANGGGAISFNSTNTTKLGVYNCIFNKNVRDYTNGEGVSIDFRRTSGANSIIQHYGYNLIQSSLTAGSGNRSIAGNINNANPTALFASTTEGDYNFLWPAQTGVGVNAGNDKDKDNNSLYTDIANAKDLLNTPRANGVIDLGAIEWSTVLPVKVSSFTTSLVNNRTQLKWSVGTEDNVNHYEVERSQNGVDFTKVTEVKANGSASYQTTDNNPQVGDNYYRLVTVDNDGSSSQYGTIGVVKVGSLVVQNVQVYPNPVTGNVVNVSLLAVPQGNYGYKLVNTSGSVVQQGNLSNSNGQATLNLSALSSGLYILQLSSGSLQLQGKLIKQ